MANESGLVKLETIYQDLGPKASPRYKFIDFKATIGDKIYDPIPIRFLRISELQVLQEMLEAAVNAGANKIAKLTDADWSRQCNECGSNEYTSSVSGDDLDSLSCGNCGSNEFHKVWIK
jgi:ribosomal protein S27AE